MKKRLFVLLNVNQLVNSVIIANAPENNPIQFTSSDDESQAFQALENTWQTQSRQCVHLLPFNLKENEL